MSVAPRTRPAGQGSFLDFEFIQIFNVLTIPCFFFWKNCVRKRESAASGVFPRLKKTSPNIPEIPLLHPGTMHEGFYSISTPFFFVKKQFWGVCPALKKK